MHAIMSNTHGKANSIPPILHYQNSRWRFFRRVWYFVFLIEFCSISFSCMFICVIIYMCNPRATGVPRFQNCRFEVSKVRRFHADFEWYAPVLFVPTNTAGEKVFSKKTNRYLFLMHAAPSERFIPIWWWTRFGHAKLQTVSLLSKRNCYSMFIRYILKYDRLCCLSEVFLFHDPLGSHTFLITHKKMYTFELHSWNRTYLHLDDM